MGSKKKHCEDKDLPYCNRVLVGNWYEASKLEEYKLNNFLSQMKSGHLMLARFRKMVQNLNTPVTVTQAVGAINFGSTVCLYAPHVPATDPPTENKKGLILGGRLNPEELTYSEDLEDGSAVAGIPDLVPKARSAFVLTSSDYCNRDDESLKYNQEFMLAVATSVKKKKPLYLRYDPNPVPGINGAFPLYLSKHPVSNARWRILPVQKHYITRFEQEGKPVQVNEDVIINHCPTNINLGINLGCWALGFTEKLCAPIMKTCKDVYGRELPNNIWQIYVPIPEKSPENDKS